VATNCPTMESQCFFIKTIEATSAVSLTEAEILTRRIHSHTKNGIGPRKTYEGQKCRVPVPLNEQFHTILK
jgi:hypothetical protein